MKGVDGVVVERVSLAEELDAEDRFLIKYRQHLVMRRGSKSSALASIPDDIVRGV